MKIVYFIDHLRPDGTQRVLTQMVQGLGGRGHSQAVVCLNNSWDDEVVKKLQANGCPVRVVGKAALVIWSRSGEPFSLAAQGAL